ncbi:MAG: cryptochrome/photolyase family protein, partial [Verrucomicrobiota bacterium]|nr:cryptochrome/photolyase family protein [Verrucomicrobiota bacterium]
MKSPRHLIVIFGDQLNREAAAFDNFDFTQDAVWMAEVDDESKHVWSHKQRIAIFLSGMRHFRDALLSEDIRVEYTQLDDGEESDKLSNRLGIDLRALSPEKVIVTQPGEWRVLQALKKVCCDEEVPLEVRDDRHFYTNAKDFEEYAKGRKSLRMEFFYRELRKRFDVLMEDGKPTGGDWNYDKENRGSFGKGGPEGPSYGPGFKPDVLTREVLDLVNERFADHPGSLDSFAWPVTPEEAQKA